jgi:hypothetical protein
MVRVIFDGSVLRLASAQQQSGGGPIAYFEGFPYQRGYGYFTGVPRQRGHGVGAVLRNLWRYLRPLAMSAKPLAVEALKEIGKEGLESGVRALNAVAEGKKIGEAVVAETQEGAKRLAEKAIQRMQGKGRKRKRRLVSRKRESKVTLLPSDVIGRTVPQKALLNKARRDVLGVY